MRSTYEHAIYKRGAGDVVLLVGVYVDDLIITGSNDREIAMFKKQMKELFSMTDLGLLSYYLGIGVIQTSHSITLNQSSYTEKLLEMTSMLECNSCQLPIELRLKLIKESN